MMRRWMLLWGAMAMAVRAQPQPPQDLTIKVNVDLIQVDVTVTDRDGKPVPGLKRDDFEVFRDGKRQQVQDALYVSAPAATPPAAAGAASTSTPGPVPVRPLEASQVRRTFAVFVDDLSIGPGNLQFVREALRKFIDEQIQPGDVVALYRSSNGLGLLQQFSNDKRQMLAQLERVRFRNINGVDSLAPIQHNPQEDDPDPAIAEAAVRERLAEQAMLRSRQDILTAGMLSNAAYIVRGLRELPGRKALVLFSESLQLFDAPAFFFDPSAPRTNPNAQGGVRTRSTQALSNLIDLANRSGVTFYTSDPRGLAHLGITAADMMPARQERFNAVVQQRSFDYRSSQDGLVELAEQTGGQFFGNSNDIGRVLQEAASAQEGYYLVSFKPDAGTFERDGRNQLKNHKLSVKLRKSGLRLRYRKSILGAPDADRMPAPSSPLAAALISPFRVNAIPLKLTGLYFEADAGGGPVLRVLMHIDASKVEFAPGDPPVGTPPGGDTKWMVAVLDQTVLLYDQDGQPVLQQDKSHTIRSPETALPGLRRRGLVQVFDLKLPKPGAFQVRAAVMERASRQTGSATQFVEAPDVPKGRFAMSDVSVASKAFVEGKPTEATPEMRVFRRGEQLVYNAFLYNARRAAATGKPRLQHQLILYRDGVPVFTGPRSPLEPNTTGGRPLTVSGTVVLGGNLAPGEYVLQIAFRDLEAPAKQQYALRTADFTLEAATP